jgi:uncharacterized protein YjbI with pentapeptide repeats
VADETTGTKAAKTPEDAPNPRELLDSANAAAGQARNAWLAFLGLLAYLAVAVGAVTHSDLLLDSPVKLPFLDVEVPLTAFFVLAPFLLVLIHFSLLIQHAMLAHKYHFFTRAIEKSESEPRSHPDRRLVHSYVFAQLLAGQRPSIVLEVMMRGMVWATLSVLPIFTLLFFQATFLPGHDVIVTHSQRLALALDIVLLIALLPLFCFPSLFRRRPTATPEWGSEPGRWRWLPRINRAGIEWGPVEWPWRARWHHFVAGALATALVASFSLFFATVPGKPLDDWISSQVGEPTTERDSVSLASADSNQPVLQVVDRALKGSQAEKDPNEAFDCSWSDLIYGLNSLYGLKKLLSDPSLFDWTRRRYCLKTLLFDGAPDPVLSRPSSLFGRRIVFTDANAPEAGLEEEHVFSLRGRKLQEAYLDRAHLRRADLIGADLTRASLRFAKLQYARFCLLSEEISESEENRCATLQDADLSGAFLDHAELFGADLTRARLQNAHLPDAKLNYAIFEDANLTGAFLDRAMLIGADLKRAKLQNAELPGANLTDASLEGANLENANLQFAELSQANLQNVNMTGAILGKAALLWVDMADANLRGADLSGANLSAADLTDVDLRLAILESTNLFRADLQGAILTSANLQGANLRESNLKDANLVGANLRGADFTGANLDGVKLIE